MPMTTDIATLNSAERSKLRLLTKRIKEHSESIVQDLGTIHSEKLWREYPSFRAFVEQELGISKSRAYQLLQEIEVRNNIATTASSKQASTVVDALPANEAQIRPLSKLEPDRQATAWQEAVAKANEQKKPVTAEIVKAVVEDMLEPAYSCPNCGGHERDEDGDCTACHEPAVVPTAEGNGKPRGGDAKPLAERKKAAREAVGVLQRRLDDLGIGDDWAATLQIIQKAIAEARK